MHDRKTYSPGHALFALAVLAILHTGGHPSEPTTPGTVPVVHSSGTHQAPPPGPLPVGQSPSWVF